MGKYRRIEVNTFRRRVTVVSGEWRPGDLSETPPEWVDDKVSLGEAEVGEAEVCEPVAADSPEGQLIILEAVRSLEQRLSPESRATILSRQDTLIGVQRNSFYLKLRAFYHFFRPMPLSLAEKQK